MSAHSTSYLVFLVTIIAVILVASNQAIAQKQQLQVQIEGVDNLDLDKGISVPELSVLKVESSANEVIKSMKVYLIHGAERKELRNVEGNQFDLAEFATHARPGDRILIEVGKLTGDTPENMEGAIIVLPIRE